ncbi:MAG: alpha-amylase/4-alpha-glucanotransferase domain-containing protein [Promethearchaeota archaeon]
MEKERSIWLPMVFHAHQPEGNFDWVYEDCYKKSYEPLIENIFKYKDVKFTLHFSGNLLEWFIKNKPDLINKIKVMAKRGQIEIIGGGYYEPIFAIIPYRDKIAQMKKLSKLIKQEFGLEVKGAWLSERVWEPNYPSFLNDVGLKYVIVDDNHFRSTGITEEGTFYSYITEDEGKSLRIFPINEELRYLTPWKPTYMSIDYLKKAADEKGDRMALFISDAEKMGVWGSTNEICYIHGHEEGDEGKPFIPAFFEQIRKNSWIKSLTLSEYMNQYPAKSLVYLPTASYDKMEEWVLPTDIRKSFKAVRKSLREDEEKKEIYQFLRGGFWRYFLVKYPESNNMHKKMIHVRNKLINVEETLLKVESEQLISVILKKIEEAWDEIYKAQCNDCYWHGLFGGVYLQFLRFSVYTHLINAERITDDINSLINPKMKSYIYITPIDFLKDSKTEYLIESDVFNIYVNPNDGGTIFELDYKPKSYNLLNTLTRWPEAYHESKKLEEKEVMVDRFKRNLLRLRILHDDVTLEQLRADLYYEFGDFIDDSFKVTSSEKEGKTAIIEMEKIGSIKDPDTDKRNTVRITKDIYVKEREIDIKIRMNFDEVNKHEKLIGRIVKNLNVAIDIPFFFNGDTKSFRWESKQINIKDTKNSELLEPFEFVGSHFKAYDDVYSLSFELEISSKADSIKISKFPIIAYAYTDEGYKEIYQGINITPIIKLEKNLEVQLKLRVS